MIVLYIGGVKSGKSRQAERKALELSPTPIYLATTEIMDDEMALRVDKHKEQRSDAFVLKEEGVDLLPLLETKETVLVECLSMWLNNMLYYEKGDDEILECVKEMINTSSHRVFVLNDVGSGIIATDALTRKFVDLSGIIAQIIASSADEVYHCIAGIATRIK